jgi:hypothetical protein
MARAARLVTVLAGLGLAACASAAPVRLGRDADPRAARKLLAEAAAAGPVRLELNGLPRTTSGTLAGPDVAAEAARGIKGLTVRFAEPPEAAGPARLLLLFDPPAEAGPDTACNADTLPEPAPEPDATRLHALFCNGGALVADAAAVTPGRTPAAVERLIWRTTARLFPDDYQDTYGFDLFGNRVGLGGQLGF